MKKVKNCFLQLSVVRCSEMAEFTVNWPGRAELDQIRRELRESYSGNSGREAEHNGPPPTPAQKPPPEGVPERAPRRGEIARPNRGRPVQKLQFVPTDPEPYLVAEVPGFRPYWRTAFLWVSQVRKTIARYVGGGMCGAATYQTLLQAAKCLAMANFYLETKTKPDQEMLQWMRMYNTLIRSAYRIAATEGEGFAQYHRAPEDDVSDEPSADELAAEIEKEFGELLVVHEDGTVCKPESTPSN